MSSTSAPGQKPDANHIAPLDPNIPVFAHNGHPYLKRVDEMVRAWVQEEWQSVARIKAAAVARHWTADRLDVALNEVRLTPHTLARRLDNISLSTLRRQLKALHVPPPGEIIRAARLIYAAHLLIHTRLLIRNIGERCGYSAEKHFTEAFTDAHGISPSDYRRRSFSSTGLDD